MGKEKTSPELPAMTNPRKISWLAYAIEDRASGEKAARARNLFRRLCANSPVGSGDPISQYLKRESIIHHQDEYSMINQLGLG